MDIRHALERLHILQDRILETIAESSGLIRHQGAQAQETLAARRWQMMRLLREYQIFKHTELFHPAIASGTPHQAAAARDMKDRCTAMGEAFQAHVQRWGAEAVAARWSVYEPAALAMAEMLERHVSEERRRIERLFEGAHRTRQLSAVPLPVRPRLAAEH